MSSTVASMPSRELGGTAMVNQMSKSWSRR
jgi:hypothetical protein